MVWCWYTSQGFPGGSVGKESACNSGDAGSIPGLGRSLGGRHGNPLQYSCLENPHAQRSLTGYSPWGLKKLATTEATEHKCMRTSQVCTFLQILTSLLSPQWWSMTSCILSLGRKFHNFYFLKVMLLMDFHLIKENVQFFHLWMLLLYDDLPYSVEFPSGDCLGSQFMLHRDWLTFLLLCHI